MKLHCKHVCANYAVDQTDDGGGKTGFLVPPSGAYRRANNGFASPTCSLNLRDQGSVLRMGRAFPFKQGGLSLLAVLAPMATQ